MKNLVKSIAVLFLIVILSHSAEAAKKKFQGKITYSITYEGNNINDAQQEMMPKTMIKYIGNGFVKNVMFTGVGKQSTVIDLKNKTKTTLLNVMGQKFAIENTAEEIQKEMGQKPDADVEVTDETKEIAGYTCTKVIIKIKNDNGEITNEGYGWFTNELKVDPDINFSQIYLNKIDGLFLEFSMEMGDGGTMKFVAKEVEKKKISAKEFAIPEGYKKVTREELMNSFGQ